MILMLVAAGVGIALMTEGTGVVLPPDTVFVPLTNKSIYMNHGIAWTRRRVSTALSVALQVAEEILPSTGLSFIRTLF